MKLILGNTASKAIIGGKDNLLPFSIEKEMRDYLKVKVENAWRSPAFRKHQWDGYRRFMTKDCRFPTGFVPNVCAFLEELGVNIEVIDERTNLPMLKEVLDLKIGTWELFPFQAGIVGKVNKWITIGGKQVYYPRGIIDAATNAGKNSMMAGIFNNVEPGKKALFIVHSQDIYNQAKEYFSTMFDIGEISSGKYRIGQFTIAMAKTLQNRLEESMNVRKDLANMDVLFVDETHRAGGDDYAKLLKDVGAGMRILVSGTPLDNEDKVKNMLIVAMSGPVIAKITNKFLIEGGYSLKPIIHMKLNNVYNSLLHRSYDCEYENCIQKSVVRLQDTVDFIEDRIGKKIVIAFEEIAHGLWLSRNLKPLFPELSIVMVHGQDDEREEKLESYKRGEIDVLISSTILQEGLNLPVMHGLVNMLGGKSKIRLKQFIGRLVRLDGESTYVEVLDWFDVGKYIAPHSRKRIKIYQHPEEGFEVKFHYECMKNGTPKPMKKSLLNIGH